MTELSLQEIQKASLEVLKCVADICEENKLTYYVAYGTLIGAIRHKNIIPWDDDIDIMMPRPDYDKLLKYFKKNSNKLLPLQLMNDDTVSNYPYMISRISDSRYMIDVTNEKPYGMGVFIDIYPMDGLGNDSDEAKKIINKTKNLSSLIFLSTRKYYHIGTTKTTLKRIIKIPAFFYAKLCGKKRFSYKAIEIASQYSYEASKYIGCILWPTYREREIFERKIFDESIWVTVDKYQFRAPKEYDFILRQLYGDYREMPPEKDRVPHHLYKAYKK